MRLRFSAGISKCRIHFHTIETCMKRTIGTKIPDVVTTLILELALTFAVSFQQVTDRDLAIYKSVLRWTAEENLDGVARINNLVRRHTIAINDAQIRKLAR